MKPDEKIVLLLTFLTGMFAGAALYVTVFAPQYKANPVEEKSQLSVAGEMYGGCQRGSQGCPSFRLEGDRTYQYIFAGERKEGRLPNALAGPIFEASTEYRLRSYAGLVEKDNCASFVDGIDYKYDITTAGTRYALDTCRTSLSGGSELQRALLDAWKYMESPTSTYPTLIEDGFSGWLIERFQNNN